jgi:hypothetical protein
LRTFVIKPLEGFVEWDRYGVRDEGDDGFIFGWIRRDDGFRDFVVVRFWINWDHGDAKFFCSYDTSSKRYSKEIGITLGGNLAGYAQCRSVREIEPETNLVRWQRESSPDITV